MTIHGTDCHFYPGRSTSFVLHPVATSSARDMPGIFGSYKNDSSNGLCIEIPFDIFTTAAERTF